MPNTLEPFRGDEAPVPFGVEHEYNALTGTGYCGECCCADCCADGCEDYDEDNGRDWDDIRRSLPPGWQLKSEHCGSEVITPPTRDIPGVIATFRDLEPPGGDEHEDCGLHVHLNANPKMGPAINPRTFFYAWQEHKESFLYPYVPGNGVDHRHENTDWCSKSDHRYYVGWLGSQRYTELNCQALAAHGTVEIRLADATSHMDEMEDWLRRLLALAEISLYRPGDNPGLAAVRTLATGQVSDYGQALLEAYVRRRCEVDDDEVIPAFDDERYDAALRSLYPSYVRASA